MIDHKTFIAQDTASTPLAFANVVPRGRVGVDAGVIVAPSNADAAAVAAMILGHEC